MILKCAENVPLGWSSFTGGKSQEVKHEFTRGKTFTGGKTWRKGKVG